MQHYCFIPSRLSGSDVIGRLTVASDASIPVALYRTQSAADAGEVQRLVFGLQTDDDADDTLVPVGEIKDRPTLKVN